MKARNESWNLTNNPNVSNWSALSSLPATPGHIQFHTSGHDYLDAERASCLINTHWNTVWSNGQSWGVFPVSFTAWFDCVLSVCCNSAYCASSSSTFPGLGFEPQSRRFFRFFFFFQLSATVNQWRIFFEQLYRLINMSCHSSHITKKCLDWDSNPRPGNVECQVELELPQNAVEEKRESALWFLALHTVFQWEFIRQLPLSPSR